jgi:predicted dehydrogenase
MPESIKVGVLTEPGAAHVEIYLDCLANCTGVAEVAVAKSGADYRALLRDHHPDLVIVSLEADHAPAVIEAALQANAHVLAEKPACTRAEDFERLNTMAEARHRFLMLAFATRTSPLAQKARQLVRDGSLGKLYGASMIMLADQTRLKSPAYQKSWFASPERAGGGHLIWLGIHYVDILQFISGQKITRVCGFTGNAGGQPIRVEDSASVSLQFEGGMLATLQSGYYLDSGYQSQIALWGSNGWLRMDLDNGPLEWRLNSGGGVQSLPGGPQTTAPLYPAFVQAVVDAVRGRTAPPVTGRESLETLRAIFGLYRAAATGETQTLASN